MSGKKPKQRAERRNVQKQSSPLVGFAVTVSALCHLLIFVAIVVATDRMPHRIKPLGVMNVSLVSVPQSTGPLSKASKASAKSQKAVRRTENQTKTNTVSIPTKKPTVKKSLKKKTFKAEKVVKQTLSKIEKKVEQSRPPALDDAFSRLKRSVENAEEQQKVQPRTDQESTNPSGGIYGKIGDQDQAIQDRLNIYHAEIAYHIRRNWVYSEHLAGRSGDLETALGITILPTGEISDIWFDQKSGNAHLDDSAYKAVMKSNPLPPLPPNLFKSTYTIGLRFGPKGLK